MDLVTALSGVATAARAVLRLPLVHLRLIIDTPVVWVPLAGAVVLVAVAWRADREHRPHEPWPRIAEGLACVFGVAMLVWMFHAGRFPWSERPLACIVWKKGAELDPAQIGDLLGRHLLGHGFAKWQLPDRYEVIDGVPRTSTGKFWKLKLRERFPR